MILEVKFFETFFRAISYAVVVCGFLALYITGGLELYASILFLTALISAWFFEGSRWQISERIGTISLFIVIPLFYFGWKYNFIGIIGNESQVAGMLAQMILILTTIKLFQKKSDRDWLFLYLMAFFELLLAAGMSISPLYLGTLVLYLLINICAIVTFEIRKTSNSISLQTPAKKQTTKLSNIKNTFFKRLPLTSIALLLLIVIIATPLFFALPRTSGAGFGNNSKGLTGFTGFSDSVELGAIGQLKQSDEIVMRVVLDKLDDAKAQSLRWRGVALDTFDNKRWNKSDTGSEPFVKLRGDFFQFDKQAMSAKDIAIQTVYLEPINSDVLFALSRPFAAEQTTFQEIHKDENGGLTSPRRDFERVSYTIYSDRWLPKIDELRTDDQTYSEDVQKKFLQLPPKYDARIKQLAAQITEEKLNRYDKAKALENYLQNNLGYTLELKAKGEEPLADFLFNVREGHCEYFATAMAIMLRTQGIASRIVNGFQQGEYNETADAFIVKQKDAHSWVEVYFPKEDVWVPFDPTPSAGQSNETDATGILGTFNKYIEALETIWIQYFVSYDNQEQRSLFRSARNSFSEYQAKTSAWTRVVETQILDWWKEVRGDKGLQASAIAVAYGIAYILAAALGIFLAVWVYRRLRKLDFWQRWREWLKQKNETTIVEFYERMQKTLANKGFTREPHQTPLEFAFALRMSEAVKITEKYNSVRFGDKKLSREEVLEIEEWLQNINKDK